MNNLIKHLALPSPKAGALIGLFFCGLLTTTVALAQDKTRTQSSAVAIPQSTVMQYQAKSYEPVEGIPGDTGGNLDIKITSGEAIGYAFIKQLLPLKERVRELPYVEVEVTPEAMWEPYWNWNWEVKSPSTNQLKADLTFDWYGQASCPGSLTSLTLSGPGGSLSQSPLTNPIWGYFKYQSFDANTPKNICLDWAEADNCDFTDPGIGCAFQKTFIVSGGSMEAPNDLLHLKASCNTGPVADEYVAPIMELRCIKVR